MRAAIACGFVALRETIVRRMAEAAVCGFAEGVPADQVMKRYPTWDAVLDYCVYSANPWAAVLYLCGYRDEERQKLSDATCTALQLQISGRTFRGSGIGRIYIPLNRRRRMD